MFFKDLAIIFESISATSSRLKMTEILADLFTRANADEIDKICYLLGGRVVPLYDATEFGMADKMVIRAISLAFGVEPETVSRAFKETGDLGKTVHQLKTKNPTVKNLKVTEVFAKLKLLAETAGVGSQDKKIYLLSELLKDTDPLSRKFIVRIPLDKLRLGFSEMTILDALSWMLTGDKTLRAELEDAYNVRPDIGYIAKAVKVHGTAGLSEVKAAIGAPILAALCQRLPNAEEMIKKMGEVEVEPKYDGVRCQIHWRKITHTKSKSESGFDVRSFSRNLENTTAMFPELFDISAQIDAEAVILDSEAVGIDRDTGRILPFQETTTRKRKHDIGLFSSQVPIRFFVFDILYKDGRELLSAPLSYRRKILEETIKKDQTLILSPHIVTDSISELRRYHDKQIKLGLEGAVVKKWSSTYEPGRRGFNWVKFKEEGQTGKLTDTIDCVVMGYYLGEGKRAQFGIGAFLVGVISGDKIVTVTKIGTGVSDQLWQELKKRFEGLKVRVKPKQYTEINKTLEPDVWISPEIVVEVAGDDLTVSPIHGAGYAIRFPRLVRIRDDKNFRDANTQKEVKNLYQQQLSVRR